MQTANTKPNYRNMKYLQIIFASSMFAFMVNFESTSAITCILFDALTMIFSAPNMAAANDHIEGNNILISNFLFHKINFRLLGA